MQNIFPNLTAQEHILLNLKNKFRVVEKDLVDVVPTTPASY